MNNYLKTILQHIVIWTFAFAFFALLRDFGQGAFRDVEPMPFSTKEQLQFLAITGVLAGVLFGTYNYLFNTFIQKEVPFGIAVILGSLGYIAIIITFVVLAFKSVIQLFEIDMNISVMLDKYLKSGAALVLIFYCFIVGFLIDFIKGVNKNLGGNLLKTITGKFYRPKEEERIFMFLDMRASTTIAEQLGHIKYSKLIQDCFKDLDVVAKHKAQVYQYVGDEAVLTWTKQKGLKNNNVLKTFYTYRSVILSKSAYYSKTYGLVPEFKAGVNLGKVIVAEVGQLKREIAYHGDTINTAARIQSKCNDYQSNFLVSESIINNIKHLRRFVIQEKGSVLLRGKSKEVKIFAVSQK